MSDRQYIVTTTMLVVAPDEYAAARQAATFLQSHADCQAYQVRQDSIDEHAQVVDLEQESPDDETPDWFGHARLMSTIEEVLRIR